MIESEFNAGLLDFLDGSPTPLHAVKRMSEALDIKGFQRLDESDSWSLEAGRKYYVTRNGTSIIAFTLPHFLEGFVMLGAHTDSPNLKIKPNPVVISNGFVQLGVEPYGGLLLNPWFDRDLSIAGRVTFLASDGEAASEIIDFVEPLAMIPSLAIHLDKDANKNRSINPQTDIIPIIGCAEEFGFEQMILDHLSDNGTDAQRLLSHDLSFYDTQKAGYVGLEREFIVSARIDNLISCYVNTRVMCSVEEDDARLMVCLDHEEVGSETTAGAAGSFLESVLRRITKGHEDFTKLMRRSFLVSCDNAHGVHPNFPSVHDENHAPKINGGPVIKVNANQRYASNSETIARFVQAAEHAGKRVQHFVSRSDMGCGSTIGPVTAASLGVDTVDIGLPTLAMHSIRELAGSGDAMELYEILLQLHEKGIR